MLPVFNANCPNAPPCRKLHSRKRGGDACRAIPDPLSEDGTSAYNVISVGYPNRNAALPYILYVFFRNVRLYANPVRAHGGFGGDRGAFCRNFLLSEKMVALARKKAYNTGKA